MLSPTTQSAASKLWQQFFCDPSLWWDNRPSKQAHYKSPDFKHIFTGQGLWINAPNCPDWVQLRLDCLEDPKPYKSSKARYKHGEGPVDANTPEFGNHGKERLASLLSELRTCNDIQRARDIHEAVVESGELRNIYVANTLVRMYSRCASMVDARKIFDGIQVRTVVSWNALIMGYVENGEEALALQIFQKMQHQGYSPAALTFVAVIKACIGLVGRLDIGNVLEIGVCVHSQAVKHGCHLHIYVATSMIDMYAKCGDLSDAKLVFDRIAHCDIVSRNALMLAYVENGQEETALELFRCMRVEGFVPDAWSFVVSLKACSSLAQSCNDGKKMVHLARGMELHFDAETTGCCASGIFVPNTLIDMYASCGSVLDARKVFDRMQSRDTVSWNALIFGYVENGQGDMALELVKLMHSQDFLPDSRTYVAALKACGMLVAWEVGRMMHIEILRRGLDSQAAVAGALVVFYGKCGSMADAQQLFDSLPQLRSDLVIWNALISGYSRQGDTTKVFILFERLRDEMGLQPDGITFVSVLSACVHGGLVDKGKMYFEEMSSKYGVSPGIQHYGCMVNLLSRANQLENAALVVTSMPCKPDDLIWTSIVAAANI